MSGLCVSTKMNLTLGNCAYPTEFESSDSVWQLWGVKLDLPSSQNKSRPLSTSLILCVRVSRGQVRALRLRLAALQPHCDHSQTTILDMGLRVFLVSYSPKYPVTQELSERATEKTAHSCTAKPAQKFLQITTTLETTKFFFFIELSEAHVLLTKKYN